MPVRRVTLILAAAALLGPSAGADQYGGRTAQRGEGPAPRYTFSWPLDGDALQPRGGTTKGPPVTLDTAPSEAWQALQAAGLSDRERDRRAILAMAGTYRVTFDFLQIVSYADPQQAEAPYQSWGTEKVYVDEDSGDDISLVHVLEMRFVEDDGSISEPIVTKHWRQSWHYEPAHIDEYRGGNRWRRRALTPAQAKGAWVQTVYQVDESPRYASLGRWRHTPSFSTWLSGKTWRPLPRREWSVREDYQVLVGSNRHTVVATGWLQEENNLKTVAPGGELDETQPYLGREYGVARYERIRDADFAAADRYYERTRDFWRQVLATWHELFAEHGEVTLRGPVDRLGLFRPLFERADEIAARPAPAPRAENSEVIRGALREMGAIGP